MELGATAGFGAVGVEGMAGLRGEVSVGHALGLVAAGGAQRWSNGDLDVRDGLVGLSWAAVTTDKAILRVQPGVGIPVGSVGSSLAFQSLSTGSFDPWVTASAVYGGAWLGLASVEARVPLYAGFDGVRQGWFGRSDLGLARRFSKVVATVGGSAVTRAPGEDPSGAFTELAATAGAVWAPVERWSFSLNARVPFVGVSHYQFAAGLGVTAVVGKRGDEH